MKQALIRADASPQVGYGHLIRSAALGQELLNQGVKVEFATATSEPALCDYLKTLGFELHLLRLSQSELGSAADIRAMKSRLRDGIEWLVLDNEYFSRAYQAEMRSGGISLLVLDDQNAREFTADLIVNPSLQAKPEDYKKAAVRQCLTGAEYALMRKELTSFPKRVKNRVENILLMLGGSPQEAVYEKILAALFQTNSKPFNVRLLTGASKEADIKAMIGRFSGQKIEHLAPIFDLAPVYDWADLVICAGGGSCYELCHFGITGLVGALAPNQLAAAREWDRRGLFLSVGLFAQQTSKDLGAKFGELLEDASILTERRRKAARFVDGRGPYRVFQAMSQLQKEAQNA